MTARLLIRAAASAELPEVAKMHGVIFPDDPWDAQSFTALLGQPGVSLWLVSQDQEPAGLMLVRVILDEAEILTFGVLPASRRKGLGAALLDHTIQILQRSGVKKLFLEVAEDNEIAIFTYENAGFIKSGTRAAYYKRGSDTVNATVMVKEIGAAPDQAN